MRRPGIPIFLQRSPYRRRRRIDAARLLPVFGAFLLLLPILWEPEGGGARSVVQDGLYLFGIWAGLVAVALALVPGLNAPEPAAKPAPEPLRVPGSDAGTGTEG